MLQEGDACRVLADRHSGAIVQVVGLPHKRRPNTYKVRNWVGPDKAYTYYYTRDELEYLPDVLSMFF